MTEPPLKNLPIGLPSWQAIRRQDLFFLDKTSLLDALVTVQRKVLFTRPSRMGKTLLCSILKELFTHGNKNFEGIFINHTWTMHEILKDSGLIISADFAFKPGNLPSEDGRNCQNRGNSDN